MKDNEILKHREEEILLQLSMPVLCGSSVSIVRLPGAGSSRRYYRLSSGSRTVIGVFGSDVAENRAFVYLSRHFVEAGLPMPHVYAVSDDEKCYIVEDFGDSSLFRHLDDVELIERTVQMLPAIQFAALEKLDFSECYPVAVMDRQSVMWDLNYFKYCFLKPSGEEFDELALENDFNALADVLLNRHVGPEWGFMYRDFQSRNIMVMEGAPRFIDFQGGRRGPCHYDLVSFLWQARADFDNDLKLRMIDAYLNALQGYVDIDRDDFKKTLRHFVLFRLLQVLGAYGFRGLVQNKSHFVLSIVPALRSLKYELESGFADDYPELKSVLRRLVETEMFQQIESEGLTVRVNSFGFKKSGIPRDMSGNGGGFVFDCRSLPNPGRYEEYKSLTGRDDAVRQYLENYPEVEAFFTRAEAMVLDAAECYCERGFNSLCVNFGCTGGQHRSVYMAERMARSLIGRFTDVHVVLNHIEQDLKFVMR